MPKYEGRRAEPSAQSSLGEQKQKNKRAFHNDLLPRGLLNKQQLRSTYKTTNDR